MVGAVVAAAASAIFAGSTAVAWAGGGFSLFVGFSVSKFVTSLALGTVAKLLTPKPKKPSLGSFSSIENTGLTQQFRQAVTERYIVYGECRVSGPLAFIGASDSSNDYLHMVIMLAGHEIESIDEVLVNDESITPDMIDGSGDVTAGKFSGFMRIKKHLGAADQTADSDLIADTSKWTSAHRLRGIAYLYVRMKWDRDKFAGSVPDMSAWVRGKKVLDVREVSPSEAWSPNIALMACDYAADAKRGFGIDIATLDDTASDAAANMCDEMVVTKPVMATAISADSGTGIITLEGDVLTLFRGDLVQAGVASIGGVSTATDYYVIPYQRQGTPRIMLAASLEDAIAGTAITLSSDGTATFIKNAEPRYHGGGVLKESAARRDNMAEIVSGMGGDMQRVGGAWYVQAAGWRSPEVAFDEDDFTGGITVQTDASRADKFNRVQGVYVSQLNQGNPQPYPVVQSTTYQDTDGGVLERDLPLSFTQRPQTAQRIAKATMERARQAIRFKARYRVTAMKVKVGDTFYQTFEKYGWDNKIFEVLDWRMGIDTGSEGPVPFVEITAQEAASAVYDFDYDEEVTVDPAPNTSLPDPFTVLVVIGFSLDSLPVETLGGDTTYKIVASWSDGGNAFVTSGGEYEIQYRKTGSAAWVAVPKVDGESTSTEIFQSEIGVQYDVRIRALNSIGVPGAWTTVEGFIVGSELITIYEDWENTVEARDPDDWENDSEASEDWD